MDGMSDETTAVLVPSWLTGWVSVPEVLVVKLVSPPYTTVIVCAPTARALVLKLAEAPDSVPVPRVPAPSLKVTVPVGVPEPGELAVTVAVKVTDWPNTEGFAEETIVVAVPSWLTVWVSVLEVLVVKLVSPA